VQNLPGLKILNISNAEASLDSNHITDSAMEFISQLQNLVELDIGTNMIALQAAITSGTKVRTCLPAHQL
jgi:hypothetical protein